MKGKWFIIAFAVVMTIFVLNNIAAALTFDFVGNDAKKWFDEFVKSKKTTIGGADAGWHLTADGLTTNNDVVSGHDRIGIAEDWTDYTLESQYQYLKFGAHKEAHLYVRWNDQANNYFFRTIGRTNAGGAGSGWSIEWLRKVGAADNEGDITDDKKILGDLKEKTLYGLRGEIKDQTLMVDFFNGKEWLPAGEVTYPGTFKKGGIGVGRSSTEMAFQYLRVNGTGIAPDATPVQALGKLATTWGRLKRW
ncbi:hypothetical protein FJZ31_06010 [Candidatus Poribacteria bacterium]|nr:hypothetical protein [Candidatus Poribacteria bacterium]